MISKMKNQYYDGLVDRIYLNSADDKPTEGIRNGSELIEVDTGKCFLFDEGGEDWIEFTSGGGGGTTADVDNITLDINANEQLEVKDGGISTAKIASGAVTTNKLDSGAVTFGKLDSSMIVDEWSALADDEHIPTEKLIADTIDDLRSDLANYIGSFATKALLDAYSGALTNNDYAVVQEDETHSGQCWRYVWDGHAWQAQYKINDTAFTLEQWAAINSGITSTSVNNYNTHIADTSNPHSVTKAQVGLGDVANTGDSATPTENGTTKFTTGGAYTELAKKQDNITAGSGLTFGTGVNADTLGHSNTVTAESTGALRTLTYDTEGHITSSTAKSLGRGLDDQSDVIGHSNSVSADTNLLLREFKFDAQGHVTGQLPKSLGRGIEDIQGEIGHSNHITADTTGSIKSFKHDAYGHITDATAVSVDSVPTENSANLIESGGVYDAVEELEIVKQDVIQYDTMPSAASEYNGAIVQYIGATSGLYVNGYFYKCKQSGGSYIWEQANVQPGTAISIDSVPTQGSTNAVQSGGVYTALQDKQIIMQFTTLPTASAEYENRIVQYTAVRSGNERRGAFYRCVNNNGTYEWQIEHIPAEGAGLSYGTGFNSNTLGHSNSVTADTTSSLKAFTYDAQGHITSADAVWPDIEPLEGSSNLVESGGVYTQLQAKQDAITAGSGLSFGTGANINTLSLENIGGSIPSNNTIGYPLFDDYGRFSSYDENYDVKSSMPIMPDNTEILTALAVSTELAKKQDVIQFSTMPTASSSYVDEIVQFTGTTTSSYTNGYFYKCVNNGGTYEWQQLNVQPGSSGGGNLYLHLYGYFSSSSATSTYAHIAFFSSSATALTNDEFLTWLWDNGYTSVTNAYPLVSGITSTMTVYVAQQAGGTVNRQISVPNVLSGIIANTSTTFQVIINNSATTTATANIRYLNTVQIV